MGLLGYVARLIQHGTHKGLMCVMLWASAPLNLLGFRVQGLGFRVQGLGFRVYIGLNSKLYVRQKERALKGHLERFGC